MNMLLILFLNLAVITSEPHSDLSVEISKTLLTDSDSSSWSTVEQKTNALNEILQGLSTAEQMKAVGAAFKNRGFDEYTNYIETEILMKHWSRIAYEDALNFAFNEIDGELGLFAAGVVWDQNQTISRDDVLKFYDRIPAYAYPDFARSLARKVPPDEDLAESISWLDSQEQLNADMFAYIVHYTIRHLLPNTRDPQSLAEWALEHVHGVDDYFQLAAIGEAWGGRNPHEAMSWALDQPNQEFGKTILISALQMLATTDLQTAAEYLINNQGQSPIMGDAIIFFANMASESEPKGTALWSQSILDPELSNHALNVSLTTWAFRDRKSLELWAQSPEFPTTFRLSLEKALASKHVDVPSGD